VLRFLLPKPKGDVTERLENAATKRAASPPVREITGLLSPPVVPIVIVVRIVIAAFALLADPGVHARAPIVERSVDFMFVLHDHIGTHNGSRL